jgi:TonB family protein
MNLMISLFEEFLAGKPRRRFGRKRAAGLAATLAVHALLILAAVTARFEVKFLPVPKKAIDVFPGPRIRVSLPEDYENHLTDIDLLERGGDAYWGRESRAPGKRGTRVSPPASGDRSADAGRGEEVPPGSGSNFTLTYRPGSERGVPPGFDLRRPGETGPPTAAGASQPGMSDSRLKSYPSTDLRGGATGGDYLLARSSTGDRVIYRGRAPGGAQSDLLSAWGRQVVEAVQKRWILPAGESELKGGKVGVTVVVEKDGRASVARLDTSSNIALLDRSALAAITACLPFPPLPGDFPGRSLEAFFLFDCHEK